MGVNGLDVFSLSKGVDPHDPNHKSFTSNVEFLVLDKNSKYGKIKDRVINILTEHFESITKNLLPIPVLTNVNENSA